MNLIEITGKGSNYINLDLVRNIDVKSYGEQRIGLEITYSDGSEDQFLVSRSRWNVIEDVLLELVVA